MPYELDAFMYTDLHEGTAPPGRKPIRVEPETKKFTLSDFLTGISSIKGHLEEDDYNNPLCWFI